MHLPMGLRFAICVLLSSLGVVAAQGQTSREQPTAGCPAQPHTLRAMHDCYRPLLVFAPSLNHPQLVDQFNQLKARAAELKLRDVLYVPIVPEGHNQPVPASKMPTARLSEDELAAMRHRFQVEPEEFLVILIGKDSREKLNSRTPVSVDQLEKLIDSMPMRKHEVQPQSKGEQ